MLIDVSNVPRLKHVEKHWTGLTIQIFFDLIDEYEMSWGFDLMTDRKNVRTGTINEYDQSFPPFKADVR